MEVPQSPSIVMAIPQQFQPQQQTQNKMLRSRRKKKRGGKVFHFKCDDLGAHSLVFRNQKRNLLS